MRHNSDDRDKTINTLMIRACTLVEGQLVRPVVAGAADAASGKTVVALQHRPELEVGPR